MLSIDFGHLRKKLGEKVNCHIFGTQKNRKWERVTFPIVIVFICLLYSSLYFFNTYPVSEGWNVFDAELILHGQVPYRDFYYYLPPLNLLIDVIFWKFSFGYLLVYRGWYLLQRIIILLLLYKLLTRYFKRSIVFISVIITSFIITASIYDLFGDYNQTMAMLAVCLLYPATNYVTCEDCLSKTKSLFIAGIIIGLMALNKQPIFVSSVLCYFIALIIYCILKKDSSILIYIGGTLGGFLIPVVICIIYLIVNGAFFPFMEQVFMNVDGKGSLADLLLFDVMLHISAYLKPCIIVIGLFLFTNRKSCFIQKMHAFLVKTTSAFNKTIRITVYALIIAVMAFLVFFFVFDRYITINALLSSAMTKTVTIALGVFLAIQFVICAKTYSVKNLSPGLKSLLIVLELILISALLVVFRRRPEILILNTSFFSIISGECLNIAGTLCIAFGVFELIDHRFIGWFYFTGAFALFYACTMATGVIAVIPLAVISAVPILVCLFLDMPKGKWTGRILSGIFGSMCGFIVVICVAQKCTVPYSWWGNTTYESKERNYHINIPAMSGIKVSEEEQQMFQEVTRLIEENTSVEDEVWGYPYLKIFNILTERYTLNTFVPVLFPDVVGDKYVEKAETMIRENNPKIILWKNIPSLLSVHEDIFRHGKPLKQRALEEYCSNLIPENYRTIGYYNGIELYMLRDNYSGSVSAGNVDQIIQCLHSDMQNGNEFTLKNPLTFQTSIILSLWADWPSDACQIDLYSGEVLIESHSITEIINDDSLAFNLKLESGETDFQIICTTASGKSRQVCIQKIKTICE